MTRPNRWIFDATVDASDKVRLRSFIKNEIAYYNAILGGFASHLRTRPEVFSQINEDLLGEVAAHGYNLRAFTPDTLPESLKRFSNTIFTLSDQVLYVLDAVSVGATLHPETRRAIAIEMLRAHEKQGDALQRTTSKIDQVLVAPVELLSSVDLRIKRHVQLPRKAILMAEDGRSFRTSYNAQPILLGSTGLPKEAAWTVLVLRDDERLDSGKWIAEFRQETVPYLIRLIDVPFNLNRKKSRAVSDKVAKRYKGA